MRIKIKSFNDATQAAIEAGCANDAFVGYSDICGIDREWAAWGTSHNARRIRDSKGNFWYVVDGYSVPSFCVEHD